MLKYLPDLSCTLQPSFSNSLPMKHFLAALTYPACATSVLPNDPLVESKPCSASALKDLLKSAAAERPKSFEKSWSQSHCRASAIGLPYFCPRFSGSISHALPTFCRWSVLRNTWHLLCIYRPSVQRTDQRPVAPGNVGHITRAPEQIWELAENGSEFFTLLEQSLKSWGQVMNSLT